MYSVLFHPSLMRKGDQFFSKLVFIFLSLDLLLSDSLIHFFFLFWLMETHRQGNSLSHFALKVCWLKNPFYNLRIINLELNGFVVPKTHGCPGKLISS